MRLRLASIADVTGHPGAALAELPGRRFQHLGPPPRDHDASAAAEQLGSGRLAEVGATARDERHLSPSSSGANTRETGSAYSPSTLITSRLGRPPSNSQ